MRRSAQEDWSQNDYWTQVRLIAEEVQREVLEDDDAEEGDLIHQGVDGSPWVFTYHAASLVMGFTNHPDSFMDAGIELDPAKGWHDMETQAAYWVMLEDVQAAYGDLAGLDEPDEYETEDEEY